MEFRVEWDATDEEHPEGQETDLPEVVEVPNDIAVEDIADWLSDKYGWLVRSAVSLRVQ